MRSKGKDTCDPAFILAYLEAFERMKETGKPQPIKGYPGWKVSKPKEDVE